MIGTYYKITPENELYHSRSHKYLRREGTPGHYRYYYDFGNGAKATKTSSGSTENVDLGGGTTAKITTTLGNGSSPSSPPQHSSTKKVDLGGGTSATITTSLGDGSSSSTKKEDELGGNIVERAQKAIEKGKRALSKWWNSLTVTKFNTIIEK